MPKYYCDYCDVFLTHDSQAGRKQHNHGRRHQENVRQFYASFLAHNVQAPPPAGPMTFVQLPEGSVPTSLPGMPGMPGGPIMIPTGPATPLLMRPHGPPGGVPPPGGMPAGMIMMRPGMMPAGMIMRPGMPMPMGMIPPGARPPMQPMQMKTGPPPPGGTPADMRMPMSGR